MNFCPPILWSGDCGEHLQCGCFKRWWKRTIGCLTCRGPMKPISHVGGLLPSTTTEYGLLKIPELSCKLHSTTRKLQDGEDLPHLSLSDYFSSRKYVILFLKLSAWQVDSKLEKSILDGKRTKVSSTYLNQWGPLQCI